MAPFQRWAAAEGELRGEPRLFSSDVSEHPNAVTLRGFYSCFEHDDYAERATAFLAPDVVWHVAGNNPLAGEFRGCGAVIDHMLRYQERSGGTLRLDTSIVATGLARGCYPPGHSIATGL